jgi:hypothetical protein
VEVLAWARIDPPYHQIMTGRVITWAVRLRTGDGTTGWFQYVDGSLRPT